MNILHISSAKTWRGGERQVSYLMKGLKEKGHRNYLMSSYDSALAQKSGEWVNTIYPYQKGIFSIVKNISKLKSICSFNEIDLIHGHDSHAHTLLWMAYRFGGLTTKSVVTRRLLNPVKSRSSKKYNYQKIEKIICISKAVKNALMPAINNPSRLEVIPSAIPGLKAPRPILARDHKTDFVVGYIAAFTEEKDHFTFIKVAKHLLQHHPSIPYKFLLVGDGPLLDVIKSECADLEKHFEFTGFKEDVDAAYKKMDILLHTSKSEALGTAILDALRHNLPVIATNMGGIPEIISHGSNGFLYNVGDDQSMAEQIQNIATDKKLHSTLTSNSAQSYPQFDISNMIQNTIDLYQKILK